MRFEAAEIDWRNKIEVANKLRADLTSNVRPVYVSDFISIIRETDANLSLHLSRFGNPTLSCYES